MNKSVSSYEQAIEYLYGRINFEKTLTGHYSRRDFKLDRMSQFLDRIGNPQEEIPVVHVAGTKGKGSTCLMLSNILTQAGYRTGLFSSPHLIAFEERFQVNQVVPEQQEVVDLLNTLLPTINEMDRLPGSMSPTFFEIATAMAWLHFRKNKVEIAVLEVGLGGRLDTTNLCKPEVTAITSISRDHSEILGSTLSEIAFEKAGIAKPSIPLVCGNISPEPLGVIEKICQEKNSPLLKPNCDYTFTVSHPENSPEQIEISVKTSEKEWKKIQVPFSGRHQIQNAALVITSIDQLVKKGWKIGRQDVQSGMNEVKLPIRLEKLMEAPRVYVDAAHNWASIRSLIETISEVKVKGKRILVFGTTQEKDIRGILRNLLPGFDTIIVTKYSNNPRAVDIHKLVQIIQELSTVPVHLCDNTSSAWQLARFIAQEDDLICVTGSFFIAAEIRQMIVDSLPDSNAEIPKVPEENTSLESPIDSNPST